MMSQRSLSVNHLSGAGPLRRNGTNERYENPVFAWRNCLVRTKSRNKGTNTTAQWMPSHRVKSLPVATSRYGMGARLSSVSGTISDFDALRHLVHSRYRLYPAKWERWSRNQRKLIRRRLEARTTAARKRVEMISIKRTFLIGLSIAFVGVGAALYAEVPNGPHKCGQVTGIAAFLQTVGITHAKIQPCETVTPLGINGEWCVNPGHHCDDGSGAGKCTNNLLDAASSTWSCVCQLNH
jgi:hypothetical protein